MCLEDSSQMHCLTLYITPQWTPSGDAFRIGADLNRLESETLPQYFRHSRFQSLVRQLNFYNFRKVNRERTFWIYKHRLFHRDKPQDLHLLRRRTCPGVDGRKNRFASSYSRKQSGGDEPERVRSLQESVVKQSSTDEDSSLDDENSSSDANYTEPLKPPQRKKRGQAVRRSSESKRAKRGGRARPSLYFDEKAGEETQPFVDREIKYKPVQRDSVASLQRVVVEEDGGASDRERDERLQRREQSYIVSQVALKLEEYARKAKRGVGRNRGRGGVVTPPLGGVYNPSHCYYRSLITYDDEYEAMASRRESLASGAAVVTDLESMDGDEDQRSRAPSEVSSPRKQVPLSNNAPVEDRAMVQRITERINKSKSSDLLGPFDTSAIVAAFCMSNSPYREDLSMKVIQLVTSCELLAMEFQQYLAALHPFNCASDLLPSSTFSAGVRKNQSVSVQQIWDRAATRSDAVRDFKTFAVNYMHNGLQERPGPVAFSADEFAALRHTVEVWSRSVTVNEQFM